MYLHLYNKQKTPHNVGNIIHVLYLSFSTFHITKGWVLSTYSGNISHSLVYNKHTSQLGQIQLAPNIFSLFSSKCL